MELAFSKDLSISVFFPAYNDAETIGGLIRDALAALPSVANVYEVLAVNDGSSDDTAHILDDLEKELSHFRVIHHPENLGYGSALRTGFAESEMDLIFYTDGDGQYDVRELVNLRPLMSERVSVVNGFKKSRADKTHRKLIGNLYSTIAQFLFTLPIRDVDCDFRLIRRDAIRQIELTSTSGVICVELVKKLSSPGNSFVEAPVTHFERKHGRSQFFTIGRVSKTILDFFILWLKLVVFSFEKRRKQPVEPRTLSNE